MNYQGFSYGSVLGISWLNDPILAIYFNLGTINKQFYFTVNIVALVRSLSR